MKEASTRDRTWYSAGAFDALARAARRGSEENEPDSDDSSDVVNTAPAGEDGDLSSSSDESVQRADRASEQKTTTHETVGWNHFTKRMAGADTARPVGRSASPESVELEREYSQLANSDMASTDDKPISADSLLVGEHDASRLFEKEYGALMAIWGKWKRTAAWSSNDVAEGHWYGAEDLARFASSRDELVEEVSKLYRAREEAGKRGGESELRDLLLLLQCDAQC